MESLTCTQERLLKLREEKRSWLERLRELERDTSQLPTEQSLDKQVFERKKEYYQSTSEARAVETQWNRWHRHKMDALEKGRPGHALSAVRKCRRMRHLVSSTKQDAITKEYRLRSAMSEQASRGVKAFWHSVAPVRIKEVEAELRGLDETLRDIDAILHKTPCSKESPNALIPVVDLTGDDSDEED